MNERVRYGATETGGRLHVIREIVNGCARGWCGHVVVRVDPDQLAPGCPRVVCGRCLRNRPEGGAAPADQEAGRRE